MSNGSRVMTTVYHVPVAAVHISAVLTNTVPTGPYRGAGRPEANHMMERMLDIAAREMNIDRVEIRHRNLVPHSALPYRSPMGLNYDSGDFEGNMDRALALADWSGFEARRAASLARGRLRGIGLANYIEAPVGAPRERIEMTVLPEGVIDIVSGTQTQGQGNPLIVEGQVHGGLAQGIGQAFSEGYYIESGNGQVLSVSYMDYGVTRAGCVPPLSIEFSEDPTSGNPLRVKGGGESGITPSTAVIFNALADALRDIGTDELPMPATPAAIWSFMHRAEETGT